MIRFALLSVALILPAIVHADEPDANRLAREILDKGTALYETHDAAAMVATYTEDARISLIAKDPNSGTYKSDDIKGREAIEGFYREAFQDASREAKAKNRVESAYFVGSDLLIIQGRFQPDTRKEGEVPFIQVRTKSGDKWLILSLQVFVVPKS